MKSTTLAQTGPGSTMIAWYRPRNARALAPRVRLKRLPNALCSQCTPATRLPLRRLQRQVILIGLKRKRVQPPLHPLAGLKQAVDENLGFFRTDK